MLQWFKKWFKITTWNCPSWSQNKLKLDLDQVLVFT